MLKININILMFAYFARQDVGNYREQCLKWNNYKYLPISNNCLTAANPELKRSFKFGRGNIIAVTNKGDYLIVGKYGSS